MQSINLPKDWKIYSNAIRDRCRDLIEFKIWSGIDINQFESWRKNFTTDEEKFFCARVLDALIYRSNQQTYALIEQVLTKNFNNIFRVLNKSHLNSFPSCLKDEKNDPLIRLVPVITRHDPVTKSSNEILRFIKRHFQVSEKYIINPWNISDQINKDIEAFIFIDDFLGTGTQMDDVLTDIAQINKILKERIIIYSPLVAHEKGIRYLNENYSDLIISYAEKLVFSNHSFFTNYFTDEVEIAKNFYIEMLKKRNINLGVGNQFGYGDLEIVLSFEHAAPDNSLQILTYRTENWVPLFNR